MQDIKTLWQLLQEIVEKEDKWYSLHEFLIESTEEDRKEIEGKLTDADFKQFYDFMDAYTFVNKTEVYMACCEYVEHVNCRPLCMWECGDLRDTADDYIREKNLNLEDE